MATQRLSDEEFAAKREAENSTVKEARATVIALAERIAAEASGDETFDAFLSTIAKLYHYSLSNVSWLTFQWWLRQVKDPTLPNLSFVATYKRWNAVGRWVRAGEKSMSIIQPRIGKEKEAAQSVDEGKEEARRYVFFVPKNCIFDVSQTEGEAMPNFKRDLGEEAASILPALIAYGEKHGIKTAFGATAPANGYSHGGRITLGAHVPPGIQVQTMIHELGHELLHQRHAGIEVGERPGHAVREGEAEAVAVVVMRHLGHDTLSNGAAYIRHHLCKPEEIRDSLNRIVKTARGIMEHLSPVGKED